MNKTDKILKNLYKKAVALPPPPPGEGGRAWFFKILRKYLTETY